METIGRCLPPESGKVCTLFYTLDILPERKLTIIPQARDTSALAAVPPAAGRDGPLRLGGYGRYAHQKGFDLLIVAMRGVSPAVATLRLAGLGPDEDALRARAAGLPHVQVGGPVADLPAFLTGIDAAVVPSRWEAFGLVALEARAAGRPVIAARTDGLVEQIAPDAGLLCAPDSPHALAAAIHDLAGRDLAAMGEAARRSTAAAMGTTIDGWRNLLSSGHGMASLPLDVARLA